MRSLHKQVQKFTSTLFLLLAASSVFLILSSFQTHPSTRPLLSVSSSSPLDHLRLAHTIVYLSSSFFLIDSPSISVCLFPLSPSGTQKERFSQVQKFTSPPSTSLFPGGNTVSRRHKCLLLFPPFFLIFLPLLFTLLLSQVLDYSCTMSLICLLQFFLLCWFHDELWGAVLSCC